MNPALPQRITLFSPDIPFPANRGGRADIWRRILAFERMGIGIQLVCFFDDIEGKRPTEEDIGTVRKHVAQLQAFPITKGMVATIHRLPQLAHTPWHAACRTLRGRQFEELQSEIAAFDPDWLWTEGPWCGRMAAAVADSASKPFIYRSHNIEHLYMQRQAKAANRSRDKLALNISCFGLERYERFLLQRADWVFDISVDDLEWWRSDGLRNISWLAPLSETSTTSLELAACGPPKDVLFLGNLSTPNNVQGVAWLVREVRPLVLAVRPQTQFVIAGSRPGAFVKQLCQAENVTLLADVPDALALYRSARVLVNPVRTGSGTHMKVIEMLMMDAPLVTSVQGTQGLPAAVKRLFHASDSAEQFANGIIHALERPQVSEHERKQCRALFGMDAFATTLVETANKLHAGVAT